MDNETMNITSATFSLPEEGEQSDTIKAVIDGVTMLVPVDPQNRHYKEILRQTKSGKLKIEGGD